MVDSYNLTLTRALRAARARPHSAVAEKVQLRSSRARSVCKHLVKWNYNLPSTLQRIVDVRRPSSWPLSCSRLRRTATGILKRADRNLPGISELSTLIFSPFFFVWLILWYSCAYSYRRISVCADIRNLHRFLCFRVDLFIVAIGKILSLNWSPMVLLGWSYARSHLTVSLSFC